MAFLALFFGTPFVALALIVGMDALSEDVKDAILLVAVFVGVIFAASLRSEH
jgi:cell division protein FtsW (lipid II flippase)